MLQRLEWQGLPLPRLYVAENKADADLAMEKGIPFIKWNRGQEELIKLILRPFLERMFPDIRWSKVLGRRKSFKTNVITVEGGIGLTENEESVIPNPVRDEDGCLVETADIATDQRVFANRNSHVNISQVSLEEYVGDMSAHVNVEVLQSLRLMPTFIGDIIDCIKVNIGSGIQWREGYNKKRGLYIGNYDAEPQLPNLIIIDVSYSIPRGIASTMLALADTLRTQVNADIIITGRHSVFFPAGCELPDPERLRRMVPLGQESSEFIEILETKVKGRKFGHVFSFGDFDQPYYGEIDNVINGGNWGYVAGRCGDSVDLVGTEVRHVHHYHTRYKDKTGYARWCHFLAQKPEVSFDTTWCNVIVSD